MLVTVPPRQQIDNRSAYKRGYRAARHYHDSVQRRDEARLRFVRKYGTAQVEVWDRGWEDGAVVGNRQPEYR